MALFKVIIKPSALLDFQEARAYYRAISAKVVRNLNAKIDRSIEQIANYPLAFSIRAEGNRRYNLKKFQYAIYYSVDIVSQSIFIHAFVHTSRNYPPSAKGEVNIHEP